SFPPRLDAAFKVNVAKMRVQIPMSVRPELEKLIQKLTRDARKVYDRKEHRNLDNTVAGAGASSASRSVRTDGRGHPSAGTRASGNNSEGERISEERRLTFSEWHDLTLKSASGREKPYMEAVLRKVLRKHSH